MPNHRFRSVRSPQNVRGRKPPASPSGPVPSFELYSTSSVDESDSAPDIDLPPAPKRAYSYPIYHNEAKRSQETRHADSWALTILKGITACVAICLIAASFAPESSLERVTETVACRIPGVRTLIDCAIQTLEDVSSRRFDAERLSGDGLRGRLERSENKQSLDDKVKEWIAGSSGEVEYAETLEWMQKLRDEETALKERLQFLKGEFVSDLIQLGVVDENLE